VDFPATQQWKRGLLAKAAIAEPPNLTFVPLDFEHQTLGEGLSLAGLKITEPAFCSWLGVVPYLSLEAFRSTIATIAELPHPTAVAFDFAISPELLPPRAKAGFEMLAQRVAAAGEPFRLFFKPEELEVELRNAGFPKIELTGADDLNALYFADRADGLALPSPGLGMMACART
jgi:O-methyltransferase involved in polyketide biosynthesis